MCSRSLIAAAAFLPVFAQTPEALSIVERRCLACHGAQTRFSGLDLSSLETARKGGTRGAAITPGSAESSLLFQRVRRGEMPPGNPLPGAEIETLKRWLESGAPWT
ncbi:MAG: c-type cytochrome domain-containing protein, partial [Bryobacteraceae bacterium]